MREWVAFYRRAGWLPSLDELRRGFPNTGAGLSGYYIAGVFFEFLLEQYGTRKVKEYYFRPQEPEAVFGPDLEEMNDAWLEWLDSVPVDMETLASLFTDDVVVFQREITGVEREASLQITADDYFVAFLNGEFVASGRSWGEPQVVPLSLRGKDEIRVVVMNQGGAGGLLCDVTNPGNGELIARSDGTWSAFRPGGDKLTASVLGPPLRPPWSTFANSDQKKALKSIQGSWIWIP